MLLLQTWYRLSAPGVEDMVNDNLSTIQCFGLQIEDNVPDHSILSRFRSELTAKKAFDQLLRKFNKQLEERDIMVKEGAVLVGVSITKPPSKQA